MISRDGVDAGVHEEVASYAIGALDEAEATRFEEHLVTCEPCARQLEDLLTVVDLLPQLPLSSVGRSPSRSARGAPDEREESRARHRRRGARTSPALARAFASRAGPLLRRPVVAAAAAAVVASVATAGLVGRLDDDGVLTRAAGVSPASAPWDGLRGPDLTVGDRRAATDAGTGVRAEVVLDATPWGTRVSFALSSLDGPRACRLLAVRPDGGTEVLASWVVPVQGYGNAAQPRPLVLQAATALDRAGISALRVEESTSGETFVPLVTVPTDG